MEDIANNQGLIHIFEKIFLALDAKTLLHCLLVSRTLSGNLKNPRFWFKKACKQQNEINKYLEEWNALLEITEENELRKEGICRILKIICIGEKECIEDVLNNFGSNFCPLLLSILCQEFQLADYFLQKLCRLLERDDRGARIFEQLKHTRSFKSFHAFAKMYGNFKKEVNNHLIKYEPKLLLTYENDIELFKEYLIIFGDLVQPDEWGNSLLHQAAEKGYINIMKVLASNQHDLDIKNANQETPLFVAVVSGNLEIVEFLISYNVNPNIQNVHGHTLLHVAASIGYLDIMKLLVPLVDNIDVQNQHQNTPLALAVKNGHVEIVRLLISKNVDPVAPDHIGRISYDYATDKIKELLETYSIKAYHTSAIKNENIRNQIITRMMKYERQVMLTYDNNIDLFMEFLTILSDPLQSEVNCNTLLHMAAKFGCINVMKVLISDPKDLNIQNLQTSLANAVKNGHLEIVKLLISQNVNPNFQDESGNSLLHLAAKFGYVEIMKALIPIVDNLDIQNKYFCTPLSMAVINNEVEIVKLLISNNANPNIPDEYSKDPFDYAVTKGLYTIAKILEPYIII